MEIISSYNDLQSDLFYKIKNISGHDYLKHFFEVKRSLNSSKLLRSGAITNRVEIQYGEIVGVSIFLGSAGGIKREGHEFLNDLLQFYQNEYWIVLLWIAMYDHSADSPLGKELTRAFIKNCISQTTLELLRSVNDKIGKKHIKAPFMSDLNNFYRQVFSVKNIVRNMRKNKRKKLFRHFKRNKNNKLVNDMKLYGLNSKSSLSLLFEQHGLSEFKPLVGLSSSFDNNDDIHGFEIFALMLSRMRAKGKFKRELRKVIKGD